MALQELLPDDRFLYKSPYSSPWFTLNDALAWGSEIYPEFFLLENGCRLPSGGWNCSAACADSKQGPELLWGQRNSTIATLVNCLMLPYIILNLESETLEDPKNLARKYNILPGATPASGLLGPDAYPVVSNCFSAYCNATESDCDDVPLRVDPQETSTFPRFRSGICSKVDMSLNTDIAGIGVNISYIMQSFVLLAAYFVQSVRESWVKWVSLPVFLVKVSTTPKLAEAYKKAKRLQRDAGPKLMPDRHMAALVAALVEFQKTQVFFMLSVEIAVIVALFNAAYVSASSWDQLWANLAFMQAVGFNGVYTTVFGLLLLKKAGKASWYISLASLCCVLVSSITIFKSRGTSVRPEQISHEIPGLTACFNQDPSQYCLGSHADVYSEAQITPSTVMKWLYSLVIILVMMADKLASYRSTKVLSRLFQALDAAVRWMSNLSGPKVSRRVRRSYKSVLLAFAEVWLVWRTCSRIKYYTSILRNTKTSTAGTVWPLGQIISVAVWVPVIVEYLYLLFNGIERGSLYRLVRPYYVTNVAPCSPTSTGFPLSTIPTGQQQPSAIPLTNSATSVTAQSIPSPTLASTHQSPRINPANSIVSGNSQSAVPAQYLTMPNSTATSLSGGMASASAHSIPPSSAVSVRRSSTASSVGSVQAPLLRPSNSTPFTHASTW